MTKEKISDEDARQIIEQDMPEYQLVERPPSDAPIAGEGTRSKPEAVAPDVEAWQQKISGTRRQGDSLAYSPTKAVPEEDGDEDLYELFLGKKRPANTTEDYANGPESGSSADSEDHPQSKIVVVERKDASRDRRDLASEPKGVVIDGKTGKVIGYQG